MAVSPELRQLTGDCDCRSRMNVGTWEGRGVRIGSVVDPWAVLQLAYTMVLLSGLGDQPRLGVDTSGFQWGRNGQCCCRMFPRWAVALDNGTASVIADGPMKLCAHQQREREWLVRFRNVAPGLFTSPCPEARLASFNPGTKLPQTSQSP